MLQQHLCLQYCKFDASIGDFTVSRLIAQDTLLDVRAFRWDHLQQLVLNAADRTFMTKQVTPSAVFGAQAPASILVDGAQQGVSLVDYFR